MAQVKSKKRLKAIAGALALARQVDKLPASRLLLDFDEEADVLYLSFQHPQKATSSIDLDEEGILLHYRDKELVGITLLDASTRVEPQGGLPCN